jgi:hypothetical protein
MRLCLSRCEACRLPAALEPWTAVCAKPVANGLVECHQELHPIETCRHCRHLIAAHATTVRCLFLEMDPIAEVMVPVRHVPVVPEGPRRSSAPVAVVVDGAGEAVAVVTRGGACQARTPAPVVPRTAALGRVAEVMSRRGLDAVLVADGAEVVGVVTRAELAALAAR